MKNFKAILATLVPIVSLYSAQYLNRFYLDWWATTPTTILLIIGMIGGTAYAWYSWVVK